MQVQRTIKRREGVWGIVKGDKGGASQVAPLSPLTKEKSNESLENLLLSLRAKRSNQASMNAQHGWLPRSHVVLARNDNWNLVMLSVSETSLLDSHAL